jgi:NAD(P)-dependent dehydrogenase (short-subunit alcohol dehydrogenase family)
VRQAVNPFVIALYGMPKILVLPWIALILGLGTSGKIVVGGELGDFSLDTNRSVLMRLNPDGSLDQSFGNGGKIINIASDAGRVGSSGETVYAGAKGGLIAFTKSLAREVARYSINVNCVCPGPTDTPMLATRPEKLREAFLKAIPFRRFAKPEEIADAVLFFASPQADYVTGQVMSVSGGLTFAG